MRIIDLHCHIVPGIDDGAQSVSEALEVLRMQELQGVTDVFCTSHNGYAKEDGHKYLETFDKLKSKVQSAGMRINLHKGTEVLCDGECMDDIISGFKAGAFQTLGNSDYVLAELYPDAEITEALHIVDVLKKNGYIPIIAHMERNTNITSLMTKLLVSNGALIQVNAFSLDEELNEDIKHRARELLDKKLIHFIGSDAHRTSHRPPKLQNGISYIFKNTDEAYANSVIYQNAMSLVL